MSSLEILRRLVRQQTVAIGEPVRNLMGPVSAEVLPIGVTTNSAWLLLRLPGTKYLTPDEFYTQFATLEERFVQEVPAEQGRVVFAGSETHTYLLRAFCDVVSSETVVCNIATGSANNEWGVYVDGNLVRRGVGDLTFTFPLNDGRHVFEVVIVSTVFGVGFPPGLLIQPLRDVLTAPLWAFVDPGYADPASGTPAVHLGWYNNPRVGGWSLLRRELAPLGPIYLVGLANENGEFGVTITGDHTAALGLGATVYAGFERMGVVLDADYDPLGTITYETVVYTGITSIRVQLPADRYLTNEFWLGRTLSTGVFRELTRVQRVGLDQIVKYTDTAVIYGSPYEYVLQAYGLFDPAVLSPFSEVRYVRAGDITPPGPIIINGRDFQNPLPDDPDAPYPVVVNKRVTVAFDTPEDEDYAGVRVFFRYEQQTGSPLSATEVTLTLPATAPTGDQTDYIIEILTGPCAGQIRNVASFTGNVVNLAADDGWLDAVPDTTSTFRLYKLMQVVTDYGAPNTTDQFSFEALPDPLDPTQVLFGRYLFASFDLAGNVQREADMVIWEFTEDDVTTIGDNQPPVVGLRQLTRIQQESYRDSLGDPLYPAERFALVELTARDPVDELEGVIIEYRTRRITTGIADAGNSSDTLNDGDAQGFDDSGQPVTSDGWANDEHKNYLVEIMQGLGVGQQRLIASNTVNQLVITEPWETTPDTSSHYQITWVGGIDASLQTTNVDDPRGTRSRYVVVSKTEGQNWLQVRAKDKEGLYSDLLSYQPDFDNIPEMSSVEVRIDTLADMAFCTAIADDDTQSFEWWLAPPLVSGQPSAPGTSPGPNRTFRDTSVNKAAPIEVDGDVNDIPFEFDFPDGRRTTLVIRPYSGIDFTGVAGPDVKKEVVRTPRTVFVAEPKNMAGEASAKTMKVTFFCTPKIGVVHGNPDDTGAQTAFIEAVDATQHTITDNNASWAEGQFVPDESNYVQYYCRVINPTTKVEQFAKIVDNTANTITLAEWFDPLYGLPQAGWPFEIREGITYWRWWEGARAQEPSDLVVPWIGTYDPDFFERFPVNPTFMQYYSHISGVPPEEVHTAIFDRDDYPSFGVLSVSLLDGNTMLVKIDQIDDDTKTWVAYVRKGWSPTRGPDLLDGVELQGPQRDQLDERYIWFEGLVKTADQFYVNVGSGKWYVTACPINSKGEYGQCRSQQVTVVTVNPPVPGSLTDVTVTPATYDPNNTGTDGAQAWNLIRWTHNEVIAAPGTDVTMKIFAHCVENGPETEVEITPNTGPGGGDRLPWQDAITGTSTREFTRARSADAESDGSDASGVSYSKQGSFLHNTGMKRGLATSNGRTLTWRYRISLFADDGAGVDEIYSRTVDTASIYQGDTQVPEFSSPPAAVVTAYGSCRTMDQLSSLEPTLNGKTPVVQPLTFRITGNLNPDKLNGTDYAVQLQHSIDGGITWVRQTTPASAGRTPYSFVWANPYGLVSYTTPRLVLGGWEVTRDLQFMTQPGGDGVGYQDYHLPAGHAEVTTVYGHIDGFPKLPLPTVDSEGHLVYDVVNSPNIATDGMLRIYNTKATTSGQDIEIDFSCDRVWAHPRLRTFMFRTVLYRTKDGQRISTSDTVAVQVTAGTCPTTGCITHQTMTNFVP